MLRRGLAETESKAAVLKGYRRTDDELQLRLRRTIASNISVSEVALEVALKRRTAEVSVLKEQLRVVRANLAAAASNATRLQHETAQLGTLSMVTAAAPTAAAPTATFVAYLIQGKASSHDLWSKRVGTIPNADLYYLSYDEPCEGCIDGKGTTQMEGLNRLVRHVLTTQQPRRRVEAYKNYVRVDDDIDLTCDDTSVIHKRVVGRPALCWQSFTAMLLNPSTVSRVVAPKSSFDPKQEASNDQTCVDEEIWAIRHDALSMIFPLPKPFIEGGSWWERQHVVWELFRKCEPLAFRSRSEWRSINPTHSDYPTGVHKEQILGTLNRDYAELGPWKLTGADHRCDVRFDHPPHPASPHLRSGNVARGGVATACADAMNRRFKAWLLDARVAGSEGGGRSAVAASSSSSPVLAAVKNFKT